MGKGIGGHQSHIMGKDEWLTPKPILDALGHFDLDPCAPVVQPWPTAAATYTALDDGLSKVWYGRVWMNPPYGAQTGIWLSRLADHGRGTALIFARTETEMFFSQVWGRAHGILFLQGRLYFHHVNGDRAAANAGAPSCLIAYGANDLEILARCGVEGHLVRLRADTAPPSPCWGMEGLL